MTVAGLIVLMAIPLYGEEMGAGSGGLWIGISIISWIGAAALFLFFTFQKRSIIKARDEATKLLEIERKQNAILANMGENIYEVAQKVLKDSQLMIESSGSRPQDEKTLLMKKVEHRIAGATGSLIDFLHLKSKKIEIKQDDFNFNNVLNEVAGDIGNKFLGRDGDLIFEIDGAVPRYLNGDSLRLGQILTSLIESMMQKSAVNELRVEISTFTPSDDRTELMFQFRDNGEGLSAKEIEELFVPYFDEDSGGYVGLDLFVAKELVGLMKGRVNVSSKPGKGTDITLVLPFNWVDSRNKRKYRLPNKLLTEKKVLIVDRNHNAAIALKKMFAYFRHEVVVMESGEFTKKTPDMSRYDIAVIHEKLMTPRLTKYIEGLRGKQDLKVVAVNTLFYVAQSKIMENVVDKHLFTPVNQETVFELIIDLYGIEVPQVYMDEQRLKAKVYKQDVVEKPGIKRENFADFKGKRLLIVEDSPINQKVLLNLLGQAGMEISVANNGQEGVDKIKEGVDWFDIVLMDINMPVMDGFTATKMIRLDRKYDQLPIVAFTALTLEAEINKMFNSGINAFLAKPLSAGKLYSVFEMYLSSQGIPGETEDSRNHVYLTFEGLDVQEGIRLSDDNEAIYFELLKEFRDTYGNSDETMEKLLKEHRYEQIRMLSLDLRGVVGSTGAKKLWRQLGDIHQVALTKQFDQLNLQILQYKSELHKVRNSIDQYIAMQEDLIA